MVLQVPGTERRGAGEAGGLLQGGQEAGEAAEQEGQVGTQRTHSAMFYCDNLLL